LSAVFFFLVKTTRNSSTQTSVLSNQALLRFARTRLSYPPLLPVSHSRTSTTPIVDLPQVFGTNHATPTKLPCHTRDIVPHPYTPPSPSRRRPRRIFLSASFGSGEVQQQFIPETQKPPRMEEVSQRLPYTRTLRCLPISSITITIPVSCCPYPAEIRLSTLSA